jgi:hypothetical protein
MPPESAICSGPETFSVAQMRARNERSIWRTPNLATSPARSEVCSREKRIKWRGPAAGGAQAVYAGFDLEQTQRSALRQISPRSYYPFKTAESHKILTDPAGLQDALNMHSAANVTSRHRFRKNSHGRPIPGSKTGLKLSRIVD